MSLRIRLSRAGAKKRPFYRIVIADSRSPRDGRYIERVGTFNPMVAKDHADRLKFNEERIKYWLGVGATPSDRVARFLSRFGLVAAPTIHEQTKQHLPRKKTLERMQAKEEEAKAKAEAEAQAAPAEKTAAAEAPAEAAPAEEAPAEEAPAEEAPADAAPAEDAPQESKDDSGADGAADADDAAKEEEKAGG